jgi:hypothetical protein
MVLERARAARRAQAAQIKLVASQSALASFQKVEMSTLVGDDRNCIICYNEFGIMNPDGNIECAVQLPKCKHIFGDHCIKQWLKDSDSCPYCRDKLPSEPKATPGSRHSSGSGSGRERAERIRRIVANGTGVPTSAWDAAPGDPATRDSRALERERQLQAMLHEAVQDRSPGAAARTQDIIAMYVRISFPNDVSGANRFNRVLRSNPSAGGLDDMVSAQLLRDSGAMHEHDGGRSRRPRNARHSLGRISTRTQIQPSGPSSNRTSRNQPQLSMRTPGQSGSLFDEGSTAQQRSITPHPAGPSWTPNQPLSQTSTSGSPSSLPNERVIPGPSVETTQPDITGPSTSNVDTIRNVPFSYNSWSSNHMAPLQLPGWNNPGTLRNGRPASAEFIDEMPRARQLAYEGMLNYHTGPTGQQNRNQGSQPFPSESPLNREYTHPQQLSPQGAEFQHRFLQQRYQQWYPGPGSDRNWG